jgi:hypothetical protein
MENSSRKMDASILGVVFTTGEGEVSGDWYPAAYFGGSTALGV